MVATGLINFPDPYFQTRNTVRRLAGAAGFVEKELFGNRFSFALPPKKACHYLTMTDRVAESWC